MTNIAPVSRPSDARRLQNDALPPLEPGNRLDQKTFHARCEAMATGCRAELVAGVVHMPSPPKSLHGRHHSRLMGWLWTYEGATPGVELLDNATVILGPNSEPQPDAELVATPGKGGQTRINADDYLVGPPELVVEVSSSTESYDLHDKKKDYEGAGVKEYLALALRQAKVLWFVSRHGRFEEQAPGTDGVLRSTAFPGLWLDPAALLRGDRARLLEVLSQGLATPQHEAFARKLQDP